MEVKENTSKKIVMSTCFLLNFLRSKNCDTFYNKLEEHESLGGLNDFHNNPRRGTTEAFKVD